MVREVAEGLCPLCEDLTRIYRCKKPELGLGPRGFAGVGAGTRAVVGPEKVVVGEMALNLFLAWSSHTSSSFQAHKLCLASLKWR